MSNASANQIVKRHCFAVYFIFLPPIATDETRAGERGVSPFEILKMLSGEGTYDSGHIPRVVLWRSGSASFM